MRRPTTLAATLVLLAPVGALGFFAPVPGVYKSKVYDASVSSKAGRARWTFAAPSGTAKLKAASLAAPQPPSDGVPCTGDELVCLLDVVGQPGSVAVSLLLRPEVTADGAGTVLVVTDPLLTPAALGLGGIQVLSGKCHPAEPYALPDTALGGPNACMGWITGPPAPSGAAVFHY